MRIPRLYLPETTLALNQAITLDKQSSHYVGNVLRRKLGQNLIVFNDSEYEYTAEIIAANRNAIEIRLNSEQQVNRESALNITLALSISKNQHMDIAIQKAVETGAQTIQPIISEYSSIKVDEQRLPNKMSHWQKLIISACEQSGRTLLPELNQPLLINDYIMQKASVTRVMLSPESSKRFNDIELQEKHIELLIGPEGGFSDAEEKLAQDNGLISVNLGSRILRTETAVIAAISVCQNLWGDY